MSATPTPEVLEPGITGPASGPDLSSLLPVLVVIVLLLAVAAVGVVMAVRRARAAREPGGGVG